MSNRRLNFQTQKEKSSAFDAIDRLFDRREWDDSECCVRCDSLVEWGDDKPVDPGLGFCDSCAQEVLEEIKAILDRTVHREEQP